MYINAANINVAQFVLFTVLLDFSHLYVWKQQKKIQMSGHVKTSPGPENTRIAHHYLRLNI